MFVLMVLWLCCLAALKRVLTCGGHPDVKSSVDADESPVQTYTVNNIKMLHVFNRMGWELT